MNQIGVPFKWTVSQYCVLAETLNVSCRPKQCSTLPVYAFEFSHQKFTMLKMRELSI
jgi:hypothetical protein